MATALAQTPEFNNATDLEFVDISSEQWREYQFLGGETIRIDAPLKLNVSESGGHRIFDAEGVSHYIRRLDPFEVDGRNAACSGRARAR